MDWLTEQEQEEYDAAMKAAEARLRKAGMTDAQWEEIRVSFSAHMADLIRFKRAQRLQ